MTCDGPPRWLRGLGGSGGCEGEREPGPGGEQLAQGIERVDAHLAALDRYDCTIANSARPSRVRQQPPELRCCTLTGLTDLFRLVVRELRDGKVSNESEDQVLVVAEPARHPSRVAGGAGMPPLVVLQAVGGQRPVAFQQAGQGARMEAVLPGRACLAGAGIRLEEQVGHGRGPALPGRRSRRCL